MPQRTRTTEESEAPVEAPRTEIPAAAPSDNSWFNELLRSGETGGQYGTAGAVGREGAVQAIHQEAYNLGAQAPRSDFDGSVFRNIADRHAPTMFDAGPGAKGGGRYNGSGQQLIYTSPTHAESVGETHAYNGMNGRTMVEANYRTAVDSTTGRGGVADVTTLAQQRGMTEALTPTVGKQGPGLLYNLTGEHPYSLTQQVGKGATDAGAGALRVPSATGGNQIDIIPRNNPTSAITPLTMTPHDSTGAPGATTPAAGTIKPMAADTSPHTAGPLEVKPGDRLNPNKNAPGRASSVRYGALGGGVTALGTDLVRLAQGEDVSAGQVALDTGVGTAVGAGSALATDALMAGGRSAARAGGIVGGVIEGGMSAYNNIGAYRDGKISGSQAAANTIVDTGVGVGAGMAGAAMGAAIGSIIPGAGTAVGAGLGFLGGMAGSYIVHALSEKTGAAAYAKEKLGAGLSWASDGISSGWNSLKSWW